MADTDTDTGDPTATSYHESAHTLRVSLMKAHDVLTNGDCDDLNADLRSGDADAGVVTTPPARAAAIRSMQNEVIDYCISKGWSGPGSAPVTFGDTMALLHSEISEAVEAFRDHGLNDATVDHYGPPHGICVHGEPRGDCADQPGPPKPQGVGSEFADVLIRLLDDCGRFGIDLAAEFDRKMAYNRTRPYQHGGRAL